MSYLSQLLGSLLQCIEEAACKAVDVYINLAVLPSDALLWNLLDRWTMLDIWTVLFTTRRLGSKGLGMHNICTV